MLWKWSLALNTFFFSSQEETQRFGHTDSKEKVAVLADLNDKLELDLDLALKELSLNKRKVIIGYL